MFTEIGIVFRIEYAHGVPLYIYSLFKTIFCQYFCDILLKNMYMYRDGNIFVLLICPKPICQTMKKFKHI